MTDKELIYKIYKQLIKLNLKKTTQLKNEQRLGSTFSQKDTQMANWHLERCVTSLIIRETQIKTMMSYYLPLTE